MSAAPIRQHRVNAFCDWLDARPRGLPWDKDPGVRKFDDLTQDEWEECMNEIKHRAATHRRTARILGKLTIK